MSYELAVQVLEGTGIPSLSNTASGVDALVVTATLMGGARESAPASLRAGYSGRAVWAKGNVLSWRIESSAFMSLKATTPTLRLNVVVRDADAPAGSQGTYIGYALLPLRNVAMSLSTEHAPYNEWLQLLGPHHAGKLHVIAGMTRVAPDAGDSAVAASERSNRAMRAAQSRASAHATLQVSSIEEMDGADEIADEFPPAPPPFDSPAAQRTRALPPEPAREPLPDASAAFLALHGVELGGSAAVGGDSWRLGRSGGTPSIPSALDAIPVGHAGGKKYTLRIALRGARGLANMFAGTSSRGRVWLSYKLFGVLVQSNAAPEFSGIEDSPVTVDAFALRGSLPNLALFFACLPPLDIGVCVPGKVLARARVPFDALLDAMPSSVRPHRVGGGWAPGGPGDAGVEEIFAGVEMEGGFDLEPLGGADASQPGGATIEATITFEPFDEAESTSNVASDSWGLLGDATLPRSSGAIGNGGSDARAYTGPVAAALSRSDLAAVLATGGLANTVAGMEANATAPSHQKRAPAAHEVITSAPSPYVTAPVATPGQRSDQTASKTGATTGLLYLIGLQVTLQSVSLGVAGDGNDADASALELPSSASLRVRYSARFVPPGATEASAQTLYQAARVNGVRVRAAGVALAADSLALEEAVIGDDTGCLLVHVPHRYLVVESRAAEASASNIDRGESVPAGALPVSSPGALVFELLDDEGSDGTVESAAVVASGSVTAAAALAAAQASNGGTLLTVPVYARDSPTVSIGSVAVHVCVEGDDADAETYDFASSVAPFAAPLSSVMQPSLSAGIEFTTPRPSAAPQPDDAPAHFSATLPATHSRRDAAVHTIPAPSISPVTTTTTGVTARPASSTASSQTSLSRSGGASVQTDSPPIRRGVVSSSQTDAPSPPSFRSAPQVATTPAATPAALHTTIPSPAPPTPSRLVQSAMSSQTDAPPERRSFALGAQTDPPTPVRASTFGAQTDAPFIARTLAAGAQTDALPAPPQPPRGFSSSSQTDAPPVPPMRGTQSSQTNRPIPGVDARVQVRADGADASVGPRPRGEVSIDAAVGSSRGDMRDTGVGGARGESRDAGVGGARGEFRDTAVGGAPRESRDTGVGGARGELRDMGSGGARGELRDTASGGARGELRDTASGGARWEMRDTGVGGYRGELCDTGIDAFREGMHDIGVDAPKTSSLHEVGVGRAREAVYDRSVGSSTSAAECRDTAVGSTPHPSRPPSRSAPSVHDAGSGSEREELREAGVGADPHFFHDIAIGSTAPSSPLSPELLHAPSRNSALTPTARGSPVILAQASGAPSLASTLASLLSASGAARLAPPPILPLADATALVSALASSMAIPLPAPPVGSPPTPTLASVYADPTVCSWNVSVDIRSLRDASSALDSVRVIVDVNPIVESADVTLGTPPPHAALLTSRPTIDIPCGVERLLPGAFVSLALRAPRGRLAGALADRLLPLQLWGRVGNGAPQMLLGAGEIGLGELFSARAVVRCAKTGAVFANRADFESARGVGSPSRSLRVLHTSIPLFATRAGAAPGELIASAGVVAYLEEEELRAVREPIVNADGGLGFDLSASADITASRVLDGEELLNTFVGEAAASAAPPPVRLSGTMEALAAGTEALTPLASAGSAGLADASTLLLHPSIRSRVDGLLTRLGASEAAALAAWRADAEAAFTRERTAERDRERSISAAREDEKRAALEAAWAARESERQATLAEAQDRVRDVESRLRTLLAAAETRYTEAERAKADAVAARESGAAEIAALQRRLRADAEAESAAVRSREAATLARVAEAAADADALRARVAAAEADAGAARAAATAAPDEALRDALAGAEADLSRARTQLDEERVAGVEARAARDEARLQVLRLASELSAARSEIEAIRAEAAERLRVAFLAREERYVLDGDRGTLRSIRRAADGVRSDVSAGIAPPGDSPADDDVSAAETRDTTRIPPAVSSLTSADTRAPASNVAAALLRASLSGSTAESRAAPSSSLPAPALEAALRSVEAGKGTRELVAQIKGARRAVRDTAHVNSSAATFCNHLPPPPPPPSHRTFCASPP